MGWNTLTLTRESGLLAGLEAADVYFAHSYAAEPADPAVCAATTEHDGTVVAAVEDGPLAGVQFHPERSGAAGARLLENLLAWSRSA
jgi:imidazoleglycerol phosphate synthase glutamine amidotransferase subunit HisH